ncbi:zinc-binding protein A33-like [Betta splendens]|uniref:Zinc-binding protein A33-like n=1 Tax=Betta splendens TaxID=158456 RepID=A0A6P7MRM1_BETSP|nr:zinc-binding protein A33-like [Betta splendens]
MSAFSEQDLLCPRCSEIYCLPVLLKCGHNVCKVCLHKYWEEKGTRECPVCFVVSVLGRPPINLALKIAADEYVQRTYMNLDFCVHHDEKLKIFCQEDEEPICLICQISQQHKLHRCCPIEEATQQRKREISLMLELLKKKLESLNTAKQLWEETKTYIQTQTSENEKVIKEEFEKLHLFLREEEKLRLKILRQEEVVKSQVLSEKLETIKDQLNTLRSTISDTERSLRLSDVLFLKGYKQTKKSVKVDVQEPECIRNILINSTKHLASLKFEVWKKMVNIVQYVPIAMDPNTAQPNLKLSEELTMVQYTKKQELPQNPERCTSRMCVLGATGFTSGKHSWTVDVGQAKDWYVGVALESIKRKSTVFLNPAEGFWVIGLCNGDTFWAQTSPRTKLVLKQKPGRITVELDYDKGRVVFISDDLSIIHTFKDRFKERIFPYFSPGLYEEGRSSSPLKICPLTIKVDVG